MKFTKTTLAASLALAATLGSVGQATAGIYAESAVAVSNLTVDFTPDFPGVDPVIGQFDFSASGSATIIPGGGEGFSGGCIGNVANGTTTCGDGSTDPVLYAGVSGGGFGTAPADAGITYSGLDTQAAGTIAFSGPNGDASGVNYAVGDAIIDTAALVEAANGSVTPGPTATRQITETEISSVDQGIANSSVGSGTSYTYLVTLGGDGALTISFEADPSLMVQIDDSTASDSTQLANMTLGWTLEGNGVDLVWEPEAITAGACTGNLTGTAGGTTCTNEVVSENLNNEVTVAFANGAENEYSRLGTDMGFQTYSITIDGLTAGTYQLSLAATTLAQVTRTQAVPEPAMLSLLGMGLALCGIGARRRKARKA